MKKRTIILLLFAVLIVASAYAFVLHQNSGPSLLSLCEEQLALGPRIPGTQGQSAFVDWATKQFTKYGWQVSTQQEERYGAQIINISAERKSTNPDAEWILLGAHYDSRIHADRDPQADNQLKPVPGANDGASGVAVLIGLAASLPSDLDKHITLALFDAEDQGRIAPWNDWCLGSELMAQEFVTAERKPDSVVVVDMIGDADLNIYRERNSDDTLTDEIWNIAIRDGYTKQFINQDKFSMEDDHMPFLRIGIPAVDLIDFDYAYWHTTEDTTDKLSEESLAAVRQVLYTWLTE